MNNEVVLYCVIIILLVRLILTQFRLRRSLREIERIDRYIVALNAKLAALKNGKNSEF